MMTMLKKVAKITSAVGALCVGVDGHFKVEGGHQAIIKNWFTGYRHKYYHPGRHMKIPFYDTVYMYDVTERTHFVEVPISANLVTMVKFLVSVRVHPRELLQFVNTFGDKNYDGVVNVYTKHAILHALLKTNVRFNLDDFVANKESISAEAQKILAGRLCGIVIDQVHISSITKYEEKIDIWKTFRKGTQGLFEKQKQIDEGKAFWPR